jgi:hypothetical protein
MTALKVQLDPVEKTAAVQRIDGALISDAQGRTLALREVDFLDESRLVRVLGSDTSLNAIYMNGYVMPAVMVARIDGDECLLPQTALEVEAAIKRLGREGTTAVLEFIQEQAGLRRDEVAALKNS